MLVLVPVALLPFPPSLHPWSQSQLYPTPNTQHPTPNAIYTTTTTITTTTTNPPSTNPPNRHGTPKSHTRFFLKGRNPRNLGMVVRSRKWRDGDFSHNRGEGGEGRGRRRGKGRKGKRGYMSYLILCFLNSGLVGAGEVACAMSAVPVGVRYRYRIIWSSIPGTLRLRCRFTRTLSRERHNE